ncbi:uncharacterized protein MONOS_6579 [Monocercomonoides exilis]|uniref:uncharacterized protein n=1 Tax=Monocercomonoides exilis TaxID=2049356 RepID=UPI003559D266|nr:hypothetical protein MONOS_6579 [Monocercomonoides exilis]|eukprot:MONOS_6579.1-p1 / transcript=MONOS_6579.1 / gene=MONOS_6579 / organism=Monocercomonoides_exilis_PA203 / gene_product=unspecified product / transcript_product=unspecified product / location=Mono_scaffold00210:6233-8857(-) / protein_length=743 / sequence_SO=supercontig / SO=protein_coding / is_pseudo=false
MNRYVNLNANDFPRKSKKRFGYSTLALRKKRQEDALTKRRQAANGALVEDLNVDFAISKVFELLHSSNISEIIDGLSVLRSISIIGDSVLDKFVSYDIISLLLVVYQTYNEIPIKLHVLSIFFNISAVSSHISHSLSYAGVIPLLLQNISKDSPDAIRGEAMCCLANLLIDFQEARNSLLLTTIGQQIRDCIDDELVPEDQDCLDADDERSTFLEYHTIDGALFLTSVLMEDIQDLKPVECLLSSLCLLIAQSSDTDNGEDDADDDEIDLEEAKKEIENLKIELENDQEQKMKMNSSCTDLQLNSSSNKTTSETKQLDDTNSFKRKLTSSMKVNAFFCCQKFANLDEASALFISRSPALDVIIEEALISDNTKVKIEALKVMFGVCCHSTPECVDNIIDSAGVEVLAMLLSDRSEQVICESLRVLSNICGGTQQQLGFVVEFNHGEIIKKAADLFCLRSSSEQLKEEVIWLMNAVSCGKKKDLDLLISCKVHCFLLQNINKRSNKLIVIIFNTLGKLIYCGRMNALLKLRQGLEKRFQRFKRWKESMTKDQTEGKDIESFEGIQSEKANRDESLLFNSEEMENIETEQAFLDSELEKAHIKCNNQCMHQIASDDYCSQTDTKFNEVLKELADSPSFEAIESCMNHSSAIVKHKALQLYQHISNCFLKEQEIDDEITEYFEEEDEVEEEDEDDYEEEEEEEEEFIDDEEKEMDKNKDEDEDFDEDDVSYDDYEMSERDIDTEIL